METVPSMPHQSFWIIKHLCPIENQVFNVFLKNSRDRSKHTADEMVFQKAGTAKKHKHASRIPQMTLFEWKEEQHDNFVKSYRMGKDRAQRKIVL